MRVDNITLRFISAAYPVARAAPRPGPIFSASSVSSPGVARTWWKVTLFPSRRRHRRKAINNDTGRLRLRAGKFLFRCGEFLAGSSRATQVTEGENFNVLGDSPSLRVAAANN